MHLIGNNDYEIATNNLDYAYYIIKDYNLAEENFKIALKNTIEKEKLAMYNYYMALLKRYTGNLEEYENYLFKSYEFLTILFLISNSFSKLKGSYKSSKTFLKLLFESELKV